MAVDNLSQTPLARFFCFNTCNYGLPLLLCNFNGCIVAREGEPGDEAKVAIYVKYVLNV